MFKHQTDKKTYFYPMKVLVLFISFLMSSLAISSQTDKDLASKHYNDGAKLIGEKKFKEAIAEFDQAIAIVPKFPEAIFSKGTCLLMMKQNDAACQYFQQAAQMGYEPAKKYQTKYCPNQPKTKNK